MFLEIEIEGRRGNRKKLVTVELEEDQSEVKMKFDRRPEFEVPEFRMLRRRARARRKVSVSRLPALP